MIQEDSILQMGVMKRIVVLLLAFATSLASASVCSQQCGSMTVPYPFSFTEGCGVPELQLNCSKEEVPLLQTPSGVFPVMSITGSTLVIETSHLKANSCEAANEVDTKSFMLGSTSAYALSGNNEFFVSGCNAAGYLTTDLSDRPFSCQTGCESRGEKSRYPFCDTPNCCTAIVPDGAHGIEMTSVGNKSREDGCSYSSMIYPASYREDAVTYGIELLWAVPRHNCSTLCSTNATCSTVRNLPGYICQCLEEFSGDGYSNGTGCSAEVLDTCQQSKCAPNARCTSNPTSYHCECPKGYTGDGTVNGGCKASSSKNFVIVGVIVPAAVAVGLCYWKLKTRKSKSFRKTQLNESQRYLQQMIKEHARFFSYAELEKATKCFRDDLKLGHGSHGTVYKGTLYDKTVVAIKKANNPGANGTQQFLNEVTILSQVNHRNLVRLLGCCIETEVPVLVYEYVPNGTLFEHLQGAKGATLSWERRLQIAIETAEAISYLHSAAFPPIYHRDVKSSNILLDEKFTARVADFGISKLVSQEATHVSTAVHGTPGYIDPQYHQNYQLTDKSDVYSFGVVLLELITGQRPVDFSRNCAEKNLAAFSIAVINDSRIEDIIDSKLEAASDSEVVESIKGVALLAAECLKFDRDDRPSMKRVVEELVKIRDSTKTGQQDEQDVSAETVV